MRIKRIERCEEGFVMLFVSVAPWRARVVMASAIIASIFAVSDEASAQTGVDDDRISLPEGPGSLEGVGENVEIDPNMGQMRWNIPIEVTRGYAGVTPSLALNYSSGSGSGPFGIGWTLETPTIERMTSRGTPRYTTTDIWAHGGGEELVEVSAQGDERVFRERFEKKFHRYTWVGVGDGKEGYWKLEYPDGRVGYFGADSSGALVESARTSHQDHGTYRYHLVEVVDPYGHKLRYHYDKFGGNKTLLTDIEYVFVAGEPRYSVQLDYELRHDLLSDAGAGFEELLEYRVTDVRVLHQEQTVRQYVLAYEPYDTSGGFSRLTSVQTYGLGGKLAGEDPYPVEFSFEYSRALGATCAMNDPSCQGDRPYIRQLPALAGAVSLSSGKSTLIDINGDALPDVLDTTGGNHTFYVNQLVPDGAGGWTQSFSSPQATSLATSLELGGAGNDVQILDINGDGYADLVNTETGSFLLNDPNRADWMEPGSTLNVESVRNINFPDARFMDYDNDKKIDIVVASQIDALQVYENNGAGFTARTLDGLGVVFSSERVQLSDMNGDGLNDVVEIQDSGSVRYRLNLGLGRYTDWENITGLTIAPSDRPNLDLEDLNGDGISDVVIVKPSELVYMINRNGNTFDAPVTITSADIDGDLPARGAGVRVLYADMNANGSEDVVWFDSNGGVTYLELFPTRPNLISKIDNGIGFVQKITYGTAAEHLARAKSAGDAWQISLPNATAIVDKVDIFVTLTGGDDGSGLHEIMEYTYRDGFYDGLEKQFRGFANVSTRLVGDANQEEGRTDIEFNVGQTDPWYNGLIERQVQLSGADVLDEMVNSYDDCQVAGAPTLTPPIDPRVREQVRHICQVATETTIKERREAPADWITTRTEYEYDGYGNVTLERQLGDTAVTGDELHTETEYAAPSARWITSLPTRTLTYNDASRRDQEREETRYYYDGADFEGLPLGQFDRGFLSREERVVALPDEVIQSARSAADEHGNVIATLDPLGSPENLTTHRRAYTYDPMGLYVLATELFLEDSASSAYTLRKEARYDYTLGTTIEATSWMIYRGDSPETARNATLVDYDRFGRPTSISSPGDPDGAPTQSFVYELAAPVSRVAFLARSERGGAVDEETFRCFDGKGRKVQDRTKLASGEYLVTGFTAYNARGTAVRSYEAYTSSSGDCETAPPDGVRFTSTKLDAKFRTIEVTKPDAELYGQPSVMRTEYAPLAQVSFDEEDTASGGEHENTPTTRRFDGIGRVVGVDRSYRGDGGMNTATFSFFYDNTNSLAGYIDPAGNRHEQTRDLIGRVVSVENPNSGTTTYQYDAASNMVRREDARGEVAMYAYDGANRVFESWDESDREGSLVRVTYDVDADCPATECTNPAGRRLGARYNVALGDGMTRSVFERKGYDVRGREVFEGRSFSGLVDLSVSREFDNRDRLIKSTLPDGTIVEERFDRGGRTVSIPGYVDKVDYEDRGLMSGLVFTNGAKMAITHDALQRYDSLATVDGAGDPIEGWEYTRDRAGNILNVIDSGTRPERPSTNADFVYDDWYRVVTSQLSVGTANEEILETTYDELDNILASTSSLGAESVAHVGAYTYGEKPNAVTRAGDIAYSYDAAGFLSARGDAQLEWDWQGRMVTASTPKGTAHYAYGVAENRVAKLEDHSLTLYGPDGFQSRDGVGVTYVRIGRQFVARHETPDFAASFYPDADSDGDISAGDAFVAQQTGGGLSADVVLAASAARALAEREDARAFLHSDHLGSLTAATDEGGAVRGQRAYYPFGERRWEQGFVDDYGFTGQERDQLTGLLHFQYRYLDTRVGRWVSFDPAFALVEQGSIERFAELNGYAYVMNNPLNSVDPLGLKTKKKKKSRKGNKEKRQKTKEKLKKAKAEKAKAKQELKQAQTVRDGIAEGSSGQKKAQEIYDAKKTQFDAASARKEKLKNKSDKLDAQDKLYLERKKLKADKRNATTSLVSGITSSVLSLSNSVTFGVMNFAMNNANKELANEQLRLNIDAKKEAAKEKADKAAAQNNTTTSNP